MVVVWTGAGIGCKKDAPQDGNPAEFERYLVESGQFIETEYTVYKFLSDELRPVYVGGNRGTNSDLTWVRAKDHFGDVRGGPEYVKDGNNSYLNDRGVWTVPLWVRAPWGQAGSYSYTFELGDYGFNNPRWTTATIQVVPNRDYAIEYSCMGTTYDLRSTGYQFASKLSEAFATAGTRFSIANVFNERMNEEDPSDISNHALLRWGKARVSGGANHPPNTVVLFGMRDHDDASRPNSWGTTVFDDESPSPRMSFSFVFGRRIDNNLTGQERQVAKTRIAIHELGHARSKDEYRAEMGDRIPHENKGTYSRVCVMLGAQWQPESAFHFCEWHRQVLLNIAW